MVLSHYLSLTSIFPRKSGLISAPTCRAGATGAGLHFGRGGHHCHEGWQRWTATGDPQHGTIGFNQKWSFMTWMMKGVPPPFGLMGKSCIYWTFWYFLGVNISLDFYGITIHDACRLVPARRRRRCSCRRAHRRRTLRRRWESGDLVENGR